jgi:hypothetical protein
VRQGLLRVFRGDLRAASLQKNKARATSRCARLTAPFG